MSKYETTSKKLLNKTMALFPSYLTFIIWTFFHLQIIDFVWRITLVERISSPTCQSIIKEIIRGFVLVAILWIVHFTCFQSFGLGEFLLYWAFVILLGALANDDDENDEEDENNYESKG
ncbi:MAG: hypothetical protein IAF58_17390 [Leptolyngbya sp.]|nr:hypothetical protein [Candidatus Melainabacteria bacterium]